MPIAPGDHERAVEIGSKGGRPKGSTKPKWNNLQDIFGMGTEDWDKLSPLQRTEKCWEWARMILEKVPMVHLTQEQSVDNVVPQDGGTQQHDLAPQVGTANGGAKDKPLAGGTPGLSDAVDPKGIEK
jgi:hypothetical protein